MICEKKRILVVDDEPGITRLLILNLEQTGDYEVATENISKAPLAAAEEFQPDLLLLDVVMPGLDGGNLASQLQTSPKLKGMPIVFLTAAVAREEVRARHPHEGAGLLEVRKGDGELLVVGGRKAFEVIQLGVAEHIPPGTARQVRGGLRRLPGTGVGDRRAGVRILYLTVGDARDRAAAGGGGREKGSSRKWIRHR